MSGRAGLARTHVPPTRVARQARVAALIRGRRVRSQAELQTLLAAEGITVTQATLSRDLEELGATKSRGAYRLPGEPPPGPGTSSARLTRLCQELLLTAEAAGSVVVARTPPGGAHLLASGLDGAALPEVAGSVAGDDTIFLACRTLRAAAALAARLRELAEPRPTTPSTKEQLP